MHHTTVRVERPEGTVLMTALAVQIEAATVFDASRQDAAGARPYDLVWVYSTQGVPDEPLRRRDVLYDEQYLDPETGVAARYRIAGRVETYDDHIEALCERIVGG